MLYSDYIVAVTNALDLSAIVVNPALAAPTSNSDFNNWIPRSIEHVENRMQRDLDLINTYVTDETGAFTANSRTLTLSTNKGTFVVVEQVYPVISGVRQAPLLPVDLDFLNWTYPADAAPSTPSVPVYWAPFNGTTVIVGPSPDSAYGVGILGTQRFVQLSATNTSNFLTMSFPEMYIAAAMVSWSSYQRDFGQQADDPKLAMSWEATYKELLTPALTEEARKRYASAGWGSRLPNPIATPPQT
jgi:hypothetical protein